MSLLQDADFEEYTNFSGPDLLLDEDDLEEPAAVACRNTEFVENNMRTRRGFTLVWNPGKFIRVLYNWLQQQYDRLMYLNSDNNFIARDLAGIIPEQTIISGVTANIMTFAQAGIRLYMSFADANGYGSQQTMVWDGTFTDATPNVEAVFQPPLQTTDLAGGSNWATFAEIDPGTGVVTAGPHSFLIVVQTWNGYQVAPGPVSSGTPVPATFTATGNHDLQITITPASTWPLWVNTIQIAMTTADNPSRWFLVPSTNGGGPIGIARGGTIPAVFDISIDDVTLTGGGPTEITDTLFNLYNGNTEPHCIGSVNNRTFYITRFLGPDGFSLQATILVSEPNAPQYVTLAQHILNLPEGRDCTTGFALGASLYLLGPNWTFSFSDNLQVPVLWAPPTLVSKQVGSPYIRGVSVNQGKGYAWVADHTGLYWFDGSTYDARAASYHQEPDWDRINFGGPQSSFRVIESVTDRLVIVLCALDGATVANTLLVWDFTDGVTPEKIAYCGMWTFNDGEKMGDVEIVQNATKKIKQLTISFGDGVSTGNVQRIMSTEAGDATDSNPQPMYNDNGVGIDWSYSVLTITRGKAKAGPLNILGIEVRERGGGQINITFAGLDETYNLPMLPIRATENSLTPGQRFLRLVDAQSELGIFTFDNGAVPGAFAYISRLRSYYTPWLLER